MDERAFEMAAEQEEAERQRAIACRVQYQGVSAHECEQYQGVSAHECEQCGEPIPQGRREALPGVQTCVSCQHLLERRA